MFRRSPGFALTVVLTLALGIGANTAMFTVVNAVLLRPLPFRDSARLAAIWDNYQPRYPKLGISPVEYDAWRAQSDIFEQIGRYRYVAGGKEMNLTGGAEPRRVRATCASSSLFTMLGVRPALGRLFRAAEDGPNGPAVVLLSHALWSEYFGANPGVAGAPIQLKGQAYTVIGVLPADFHLPAFADVWLPEGQAGDEISNPLRHAFAVVAKLKPGVSPQQAQARLDSIGARLERDHPRTSKGFGFSIAGLQQDLTGNVRPALLALLGAVTLVLLIACVNVANLLLSRGASRRHDMAIRLALGASRARILRDSLAESLQLAVAGGAAGLLLASGALDFLPRVLPPNSLDAQSIHIDLTTLLFLVSVSLFTAAISGSVPALQAARQDPGEGLKESGRTFTSGPGSRRNVLVVAEFSLALILLMGAGLLIRSFLRMLNVNPGFQPSHVLTLRIAPSPTTYSDDRKLQALFERLRARVLSLPGVKSVAAASALPLAAERGNSQRFVVPGWPLLQPDTYPVAERRLVTPDFFSTLGIPLLAGRGYTDRDLDQPYIVVNESMARRFWPGEDPIGKRFITGPFGPTPSWSTVIGVVGDIKQFGLDSEATNDFYFLWYGGTYLTIQTQSDPLALTTAVRREIHELDPTIPVSDIRSMDQVLDASTGARRFATLLASTFAGVALALALIGIYGITAWSVAQRTQEIGIRMALGADAQGIFRLILARGMKLSVIGLTIGLAATLALGRYLGSLLFSIAPYDPWTLGAMSLLMLAAGAAACYVPARRAMQVNPVTTLRSE